MHKVYDLYRILLQTGNQFDVKDVQARKLLREGNVLTPKEADLHNSDAASSGLIYVLNEELTAKRDGILNPKTEDDKELRKQLFDQAKELGLTVAKNIKTEDLQTLIENAINQ